MSKRARERERERQREIKSKTYLGRWSQKSWDGLRWVAGHRSKGGSGNWKATAMQPSPQERERERGPEDQNKRAFC